MSDGHRPTRADGPRQGRRPSVWRTRRTSRELTEVLCASSQRGQLHAKLLLRFSGREVRPHGLTRPAVAYTRLQPGLPGGPCAHHPYFLTCPVQPTDWLPDTSLRSTGLIRRCPCRPRPADAGVTGLVNSLRFPHSPEPTQHGGGPAGEVQSEHGGVGLVAGTSAPRPGSVAEGPAVSTRGLCFRHFELETRGGRLL